MKRPHTQFIVDPVDALFSLRIFLDDQVMPQGTNDSLQRGLLFGRIPDP